VGIRNLLIKNAEEALLDSKGMEAGGSHNLERLGEYRATMEERAPFRAVRRPCFVSSLTPSPAMGFYPDYVRRKPQTKLTLHHSIPDGKAMDSPQGKLKIEQSGVPGRRTLILEPARSE